MSCSTDDRVCEVYDLDMTALFETVAQWDGTVVSIQQNSRMQVRKRSLSKDEFCSEGTQQLTALFREHCPIRAETVVQKLKGTW